MGGLDVVWVLEWRKEVFWEAYWMIWVGCKVEEVDGWVLVVWLMVRLVLAPSELVQSVVTVVA